MASPYSSGGGGSKFEDRVAAYYLVAILSETKARGVPGERTVRTLTQRAAFGEPLDDIIITGLLGNGQEVKLHLQVKSSLRFTEKDAEWITIVQKAWDTFKSPSRSDDDRFGVAISTYNARVDKHYQAVLNWAQDSVDGKHFLERINKKDFSHKDKQAFVDTIRQILESYSPGNISNNTLWQFLRSFVILRFDFPLRDKSCDAEGVLDRLRNYLPPNQIQKADDLWNHLTVKAGEIISTGGGATRETLLNKLQSANLPTGTSTNFLKDIKVVDHESWQALGDIKSDIQGFHLHRREVYEQVKERLTEGRFILVYGEPGTGKSALLKDVAKEARRIGSIFVLKNNRVHPRGWSAHAHVLSVSQDASALLHEIGTAGESILFIDGIDKISDPVAQITINDLVRIIAQDSGLSNWKILATVREQNLEDVTTWIDSDALQKLPIRFVKVPLLNQNEMEVLSEHFPRLRPLVAESGNTDIILKRPFFLESVLTLAGKEGSAELPATEAELLKLWWKLGGSEDADPVRSQHRRNALLDLADRLARTPNEAIPIGGLQPEALGELKSAGVIQDRELGHSVVFVHDIYEEWALAELLLGKKSEIAKFLREIKEPPLLTGPMQLVGSYILETNPTEFEWKKLYEEVNDTNLDPVWQWSVLVSCVNSTRTEQLLRKLSVYLIENNYAQLKNLLKALRAIEVVPHPVLSQKETKEILTPYGQEEFARVMVVPKKSTWIRFFDWFMEQAEQVHQNLLPDLLPVFQAWQGTYGGQQTPYCHTIGKIAYDCLLEFEDARNPDQKKIRRKPFGIGYKNEEKLEKDIRFLFLCSAGDVPQLVADYLKHHSLPQRKHILRDEIISGIVQLTNNVPSSLVDYICNAFLEYPDAGNSNRGSYSNHLVQNLGIADSPSFVYSYDFIQISFLMLLLKHETEGLRLVHTLCNHAISVWKLAHRIAGQSRGPTVPMSIQLEFPWGTQTFWGDGQVYLWFRGACRNPLLSSALMALEQWALGQIADDRPFEDVFRIVVEKNESVAALGIAAGLCTAYQDKSIDYSLHLVTCPHLWQWDIDRLSQEIYMQNEIRYASYYNKHRQYDITTLAANFVCYPNNELKERCLNDIKQVLHKFSHNSMLYKPVIRFFRKGGLELLPDFSLEWIKDIAVCMKKNRQFWNSNGEEILKILEMLLEIKGYSSNSSYQETISLILDILASNGVRRAKLFQEKLLKNGV